ncbi:MAG TPA: metal ABC transporter permease, partial [Acholeplasmataceae bacterium]|nr:metal ABC transporter permease [Acholeplasmataceae bacterium]
SFDPSLAAVLGFSPVIIHYSLMALVSLTAVTSFSSVGSILVVALMVGPGITAMQFTKDLKYTIIYSALIAVFNTLVGYFIAILLNVTIAGVIASVTLLTFLIVITFFPKGIIFKQIRRNRQKNAFNFLVFLKHLYNHLDHENKELELNIDNIHNELNWSKRIVSKYIKKGLLNNYLKLENNLVIITTHGIDYHNQIMKEN